MAVHGDGAAGDLPAAGAPAEAPAVGIGTGEGDASAAAVPVVRPAVAPDGLQAPALRQICQRVAGGSGVVDPGVLAGIADAVLRDLLVPEGAVRGGRRSGGNGLLPQQHGAGGGVVAHLHPQQLADGPDGQVVGLAASLIHIEDGAGDPLAVGGGDVAAGGDLRLPVQGHPGEVEAHLAGGRQGGGGQDRQRQRRGRACQK